MSHFVDIILPIPLEKLFTYQISDEESQLLRPGMRVAVPFGKSKIYTGLVHHLHQDPPHAYEAKEIYEILDEEPIVTEKQLKLWQWISSYYMCTLGEVLRAAVPGIFLLESETIITLNGENRDGDKSLNDNEFLVYEALVHQESIKAQDVAHILDRKSILPLLKSMIDKGVIKVREELQEKYKPKLTRFVKIEERFRNEKDLNELLEGMDRAPKQRDLILAYYSMTSDNELVAVPGLLAKGHGSSQQLKALIKKGIFSEHYLETGRLPSYDEEKQQVKTLTDLQQTALTQTKKFFEDGKTVLLHGVTASGKTEIYASLIKETIEREKQVLYLVPEIALTTQLVARMEKLFGDEMLVFHSRYSLNERVEVWNHVLKGSQRAKIVLGARSAVFLPFNDLGLVIIDEEHEPSYKQFDPAPRYHARDTAIVLAQMFSSSTIMGSATPSLESYYNAAIAQKYGLVELKSRFNDVLMPEIELIDLKDKYRRKRMTGHFSDRLIQEMEEALEGNFQIILFQNRRGFSPIVECNTCGNSPQCPNCDVSLTFHQFKNQLRCHYCGYNLPMIQQCQACGSPELDSKGFGTEQIEEEAKVLFPEAKVARMDLDTTRGKYSYNRLINKLENREIDVLVGTQMLTKGLDFRHVKLVGIMNADALLNFPDFRAHERSFQLMQQVAGRSGRTDVRGKVIIQTYNPYHRIVQQVSAYDYQDMFDEQLEQRRTYRYPPFYRLIRITLKHKDFNRVNEGSEWLAMALKRRIPAEVLGPEFPPIARIRRQYLKNVLVKIGPGQSIGKTKEAILKVRNSFFSIKDYRPIRVILNVDYY
ncbi:MAG: primosomal protein N' [Flavobacteriaceae bacterium]|nr:primosomal protein N' [Flavobacteriaceae bacterium]